MYDIFRNPQLKSIMMIYLMMMGFDLFGRYMIPGAGAVAPADGTAPAAADGMSATILNDKGEAQSTSEVNGDAIPIDRTYLGGATTIDDKKRILSQKLIHVKFCVGCQYNGHFEKLKKELEELGVPEVSFEEYPVAPLKATLSKVLSYSHWIILILLTFGEQIFPRLGIAPPALYYTLKEKQWMVIIGSYFICNQLSASLVNTGAFEVYDDNTLIYSKLKSGNVPSTQDILALLFKS